LRLGLSQLHGSISVAGDSLFSVWKLGVVVWYSASSVVFVEGGGADRGGGNTGP
jgi:hypothetical protein